MSQPTTHAPTVLPSEPLSSRKGRAHPRASLPLLALALLTLVGCGGEPAAPPDTYQTRGVVRQIGSGETPELLIHHEALPDFRDQNGETVGMEAMAMPFPVAEPALVEGLAVGDRIAFTFEVRWDDGPPLRLTALEPLASEERLDFEQSSEDESPSGAPEDDAATDETVSDETATGETATGEATDGGPADSR